MPTKKNSVLTECAKARCHLEKAAESIGRAAWIAHESGDNELDKSLMALMEAVQTYVRLSITLPRLKG